MKVLLYPRLADEPLQLAQSLKPEGIDLETVSRDASEEELAAAFAGAEAMMGFILRPLPERVLASMGNLKLVQLLSAGYDEVNIEVMRSLRLPVATNGGANAVAVAEHAIMLMLAVYRNLAEFDAMVKSGGWRPGVPIGARRYYELAGKTVGIVGLGMIGREVAKRLRSFETTVLYCDVFRADRSVEESLGVRYVSLPELLGAADVVSLHVPLGPDTRGMIGREELAAMKKTAILINTCRGGVVDTEALTDALRDGVILGAGLDTVEPEPPPADLPLLKLSNVTITPHSAGPTVDSWPKRLRNGYANIGRVAAGERPLWVIPELRDIL